MSMKVGILTSGSDCPGLNAAIRGFGRAAQQTYGMTVLGFTDGFRGLMEDKTVDLSGNALSDILTRGGNILGTSRELPYKVLENGKTVDRTDLAVEVYHRHGLDGLVCIGGAETQNAAWHLARAGLNILTLPKSSENSIAKTDITIGFDTAQLIAAEAIDRLHSTAHSNHRIIIVEITGSQVGWLTLGSGIAAGADVILIPEIPYHVEKIAEAINTRLEAGKRFSIVAVSEGANSSELVAFFERSLKLNRLRDQGGNIEDRQAQINTLKKKYAGQTLFLANRLEEMTGVESRVTILGYLLRGGTPSATDRVLATYLGTRAADLLAEGKTGQMVAYQGGKAVCVPLEDLFEQTKPVPLDHHWITAAKHVGTVFGD